MAIDLLGKLLLRKGPTAERLAITLDSAEPGWDTTLKRLFVGDGATAGGIAIGNISSGDNVSLLTNNAGYLTEVSTDDVDVNLIPGATYNNLTDLINTMISPGLITGGMIEEIAVGMIRVNAGVVIIREADDDVSNLYFADFPQTDFAIPADQLTRFLGVVLNAGVITVEMRSSESFNKDNELPLGFAVRIDTNTIITTSTPFRTGDAMTNVIQRFEAETPALRDNNVGGLIIQEGPGRTVTLSAGQVWSRMTHFPQTAKDSAVDGMLTLHFDGVGLAFGSTTQWDNQKFNDLNSGTLEVMDDNRYGVLWFYMSIQSGNFGYAYGSGQYVDIASAALERPPAYLNTNFKLQTLFLGRLIFKKGASTAVQVDSIFNLNLPIPQSVAKTNTYYNSSGVVSGGLLSINVDNTKFNITSGVSAFVDFTVASQPTQTIVEFGPFSGLTPLGLNTHIATYIGINPAGEVVQQLTPFSNTQRRTVAFLGAVIHSNLTTVNAINTIATTVHSATNQLHDLMAAIGVLNVSGNVVSPNGVNLSLNKTEGSMFKMGANFSNNISNPHLVTLPSLNQFTFRYRTSNSTESADTTAISPGLYESPLGTVTAIPGSVNRFSIQRIYLFQSNLVRIQYGQHWYANIDDAEAAIATEPFVIEQNAADNGVLIACLLVRKNATNLSDPAQAKLIQITKFGAATGGGSVASHNNLSGLQGGQVGEYYHLTNEQHTTLDFIRRGSGDPNGVVTAPVSTLYLRLDGGLGSTLYVKETGVGNTGWTAK